MLDWLRRLVTGRSRSAVRESTGVAGNARDKPTWHLMELDLEGNGFSDAVAWDRVYCKVPRDSRYWTDYLHGYTLEYLLAWWEVAPEDPLRALVPGCGVSCAAHMLVALGYDVVASDFSPEAIAYQHWIGEEWEEPTTGSQWDPRLRWKQLTGRAVESPRGTIDLVVCDQRHPVEGERFDLVFSERALQQMPRGDRRIVIEHHYEALKPGGSAMFAFANPSDEGQAELEEDLGSAGFFVVQPKGEDPEATRERVAAADCRVALTYYRWL
ncbi:class I SAM-dependent methyltransferase [Planctomycetota bacterium]